jgi:hypothetical protein
MRLMSFALTTEQVRAQTKVVTRRLNWLHAEPGMLLQPVVKAQGLKKGEHPVRIGGPIRVVSVRREHLSRMTWTECALEGFPSLSPVAFIEMFCKANRPCTPTHLVTRIQFEYVTESPR